MWPKQPGGLEFLMFMDGSDRFACHNLEEIKYVQL